MHSHVVLWYVPHPPLRHHILIISSNPPPSYKALSCKESCIWGCSLCVYLYIKPLHRHVKGSTEAAPIATVGMPSAMMAAAAAGDTRNHGCQAVQSVLQVPKAAATGIQRTSILEPVDPAKG